MIQITYNSRTNDIDMFKEYVFEQKTELFNNINN